MILNQSVRKSQTNVCRKITTVKPTKSWTDQVYLSHVTSTVSTVKWSKPTRFWAVFSTPEPHHKTDACCSKYFINKKDDQAIWKRSWPSTISCAVKRRFEIHWILLFRCSVPHIEKTADNSRMPPFIASSSSPMIHTACSTDFPL